MCEIKLNFSSISFLRQLKRSLLKDSLARNRSSRAYNKISHLGKSRLCEIGGISVAEERRRGWKGLTRVTNECVRIQAGKFFVPLPVPAIHSIPSTPSRRAVKTADAGAARTKRSNHNDCFIACTNPRADFLLRPVADLLHVCQPAVIDTVDYPHAAAPPLFPAPLDFEEGLAFCSVFNFCF